MNFFTIFQKRLVHSDVLVFHEIAGWVYLATAIFSFSSPILSKVNQNNCCYFM